MLQNNDSLKNSSARKNDYRIQAITSKFSEEDDSEPSSFLLDRYKAGKTTRYTMDQWKRIMAK